MPLTLTVMPGSADANSYADVTPAREYAGYRVGSAAFLALTDEQIKQALATATADIDTLEDYPGFYGSRTDTEQALAFPRDGDTELPANLFKATVELAMSYTPSFVQGTSPLNVDVANGNIKEDTIGPIKTVYFAPGSKAATAFDRFPAVVQRLLLSLVITSVDPPGWGSACVTRS